MSSLELQNDEIEVLKTMFLDNELELPNKSDLIIHIFEDSCNFSIYFTLPILYPESERPLVSLRCDASRSVQKDCAAFLGQVMEKMPFGEGILLELIQAAKEWIVLHNNEVKNSLKIEESVQLWVFRREYIWFHHIYYRPKRRCIINFANQYNLCGFCLFGKPGIVVVEGLENNVLQYLSDLRGLSWQKMTSKSFQRFDCNDQDTFRSQFRFKQFQSLSDIDEPAKASDSSLLLQTLRNANLEFVFTELLGIESAT